MLVLALGGLFGQIPFGPIRFGAAGALFMGLVIGALDPRFGEGLGLVKSLGVVLFCYTVGLAAGTTFRSDLRRQWGLMVAGVLGLIAPGQPAQDHLGLRRTAPPEQAFAETESGHASSLRADAAMRRMLGQGRDSVKSHGVGRHVTLRDARVRRCQSART